MNADSNSRRPPTSLAAIAEGLVGAASPRADRVATVFGAKGGVGASAVALAVARDLARATAKGPGVAVLLIDAHAGRSDLALLAGDDQTPGLAITTAAKLGVDPPAGQGAAVAEQAMRLLRAGRLWTEDSGGWIVIDAGVGDTAWARDLASRSLRPLLVTTGDPLSTVNAYRSLKLLGEATARVGMIVNHAADEAAATAAHARLAASSQQHLSVAPALAGWLPTLTDNPTEATIATAEAA